MVDGIHILNNMRKDSISNPEVEEILTPEFNSEKYDGCQTII